MSNFKITKNGEEVSITEGGSLEEAIGRWKELVLQVPKIQVDIVLKKKRDGSWDLSQVPLGQGIAYADTGDLVLKNAYFKSITVGHEEIQMPVTPVKGFWYVEELGTKYYGTRVTDGDSSIKIWTSRGSSAPSIREKESEGAKRDIAQWGLEEWTKQYTCDAHYERQGDYEIACALVGLLNSMGLA